MAKKIQRARLVIDDGTPDGIDLSNYTTGINIPLTDVGLTDITVEFRGVQLDVDPDTRQITVTIPQP